MADRRRRGIDAARDRVRRLAARRSHRRGLAPPRDARRVPRPGTGDLAIKRVAARPGDWVPFADGWLQLGDDEAWLVGDASDERSRTPATPPPVDSRRYGPVTVDALVARAWFRYWPIRRLGRIAHAPADLLERGREGRIPVAADAGAADP